MNYLGAVSAGYSVKQILNYFSKNFPEIGHRLQEALKSGKSPEDIMKYLSQFDRKQLSKIKGAKQGINLFPDEAIDNPYIKSRQSIQERDPIPQSVKNVAKVTGTALGGYALSRAIPAIAQQLAPGLLKQPISPITTPNPQTTQQTGLVEASQAQTTPLTPVSIDAITNNASIKGQIEALRNSGNDAKGIAAYFEKFKPKEVKDIEKLTGQKFENIVDTYLSQSPIEKKEKPESAIIPSSKTESMSSSQPETIGSLALMPRGEVGEIESIKNGIAKVNVNGEIKHRKVSELELEPEAIRNVDFKAIAKQYVESIPEKERSRAMLFNFFNPTSIDQESGSEVGDFFIIFPTDPSHIGIYSGVPKKLSDDINSGTLIPKTTAKTFLGEHTAGKPESRGAGVNDLKQFPYKKVSIPFNLSKELFSAIKELQKESESELRKKQREENAKKKKKTT